MEHNEIMQWPDSAILDFGGDAMEAVNKLESILCTSPWNSHLDVYTSAQTEAVLLLKLLREGAVAVREVCYTPIEDSDKVQQKAKEYLRYLNKRKIDYNLYAVAGLFSDYELDVYKTDRLALYFSDIKAYVRCGDFTPDKLFDLLERDCCERVIIVSGAEPDGDGDKEAFYSFEMQAPKEYILGRIKELQDEKTEELRRVINNLGLVVDMTRKHDSD